MASYHPLSDAQLVEVLERIPDVVWRYRVGPQPGSAAEGPVAVETLVAASWGSGYAGGA